MYVLVPDILRLLSSAGRLTSSESEKGEVTSSSVVQGGGSGQSSNSFNLFGIELVLENDPDFFLLRPITFVLPGVNSDSSSRGTSQAILALLLQLGGGGGSISSRESSEKCSSSAISLSGRSPGSSRSLERLSSLTLLFTSLCLSNAVGTVLGGTLVGDVRGYPTCWKGKLPNLYPGGGGGGLRVKSLFSQPYGRWWRVFG